MRPILLASGGASYFFARIQRRASSFSDPGLIWRTTQLRRLDSISYGGGKFGRVTGDFVLRNRKIGLTEWRKAAQVSNNETIFNGGLSLFADLDSIVAKSSADRERIIAVLHQHGYRQWPDGRSLDKVVKIAR